MSKTIQPSIVNVEVVLQGISPLIMNNGRAADTTESTVIAKVEAFGAYKKAPTDVNREYFEQAQMTMSVYYDDELGVYLPWDNIAKSLTQAGAGIKIGQKSLKSAATGIMADEDGFAFLIDGKPLKKWDTVVKDKRFRFRRVARQGKNAIVRVRVKIPSGWEVVVRCKFLTDVVDADTVKRLFEDAGINKGLGDWRPSSPAPGTFGRFVVKSFKEVA